MKLCIDCKHAEKVDTQWFCNRKPEPDSIDPVDGSRTRQGLMYCRLERDPESCMFCDDLMKVGDFCGMDAKYFEPKPGTAPCP